MMGFFVIFVSKMDKEFIDLYALQALMKEGIESLFPGRVWVKAEISSVNVKTNGHCYLELSQNDESGTIAKAKAVIWRSKYYQINSFLVAATGSSLKVGMSLLARVQVTYSELYGLTLTIDEVDPQLTIGQRELEKRQTIEKLTKEGLMTRQQGLELPLLPYALAVISARDAAGLGDFKHHLLDNEYGFAFRLDLYEATMQGAGAPASIVVAIESIQQSEVAYDAVLIMRGGGSELDLACFDDYEMAKAIALCPVPVFTAIGHDKDYHVADMVAHVYVKTPTALADLFLDCFMSEDERLASFSQRLKLAFVNKVNAMSSKVDLLASRIAGADPRCILSRGYALVADGEGRVRKSASAFSEGDKLSVLFADGRLDCIIETKK